MPNTGCSANVSAHSIAFQIKAPESGTSEAIKGVGGSGGHTFWTEPVRMRMNCFYSTLLVDSGYRTGP